jgi:hypothetical protein
LYNQLSRYLYSLHQQQLYQYPFLSPFISL